MGGGRLRTDAGQRVRVSRRHGSSSLSPTCTRAAFGWLADTGERSTATGSGPCRGKPVAGRSGGPQRLLRSRRRTPSGVWRWRWSGQWNTGSARGWGARYEPECPHRDTGHAGARDGPLNAGRKPTANPRERRRSTARARRIGTGARAINNPRSGLGICSGRTNGTRPWALARGTWRGRGRKTRKGRQHSREASQPPWSPRLWGTRRRSLWHPFFASA
jgi:hypothetical protein